MSVNKAIILGRLGQNPDVRATKDGQPLTQSRLKELLHYDPETGAFTWRGSIGRKIRAGDKAGSRCGKGYWVIGFTRKYYKAHRLAWLYVHGRFPIGDIDHINGVRHDNRIVNLREATKAENGQNICKHRDNKSGFIGVSWHPATRKWRSRIRTNRKLKSLGLFDTPDAAYSAYLAAKAELHTFNPTVRESNHVISQ